jgi:hypothetical protein
MHDTKDSRAWVSESLLGFEALINAPQREGKVATEEGKVGG